jgi:hypothetical protein
VAIIIGIPPHDIMQGMPIAIIAFMALQRSCIIAMPDASMGVMVQTMPALVISQVTRHIIGIAIIGMPPIIPMPPIGIPPIIGMPPPIIGMPPPIIGMPPPIIGMPPPIIGMPPIIDGMPMPPIIGFIMPMPFIIIGMGIGIIIGIPAGEELIPPPIIGIAFIGVIVGLLRPRRRAPHT